MDNSPCGRAETMAEPLLTVADEHCPVCGYRRPKQQRDIFGMAVKVRHYSDSKHEWVTDSATSSSFQEGVACCNSLLGVLEEIGATVPVFDDPRCDYVTVQVDRDTWETVRRIAARALPRPQGV